MPTSTLSPKQARFVEEYLIDGNGTAAAIRAGYARRGAHVTASRTLRFPKVAEAVQEGQQETQRMLGMDRQHVVAELLRAVQVAKEQANPSAMVEGLREIARLGGYYPTGRVVAAATPSNAGQAMMAALEAMSDAELTALLDAAEDSV